MLWRALFVPAVWALVVFDVLVLLWILLGSLKTTRELTDSPFGLPLELQWQNFVKAWDSANLGAGILNSVVLVVCSTIVSILLGAPAGYALSRFKRRSASTLIVLFVVGLAIPAQAIFIPLYVAFGRVGLTDSIFGLFIIYTGLSLPFTVFLLTGFFASLPRELEEQASIDGLRPGATFWRIMLPLARPGIVTVVVLQAIGFWGETFFALVFLNQNTTLSLSLLQFTKTMRYNGADWSVLFAGIVMVVLPLLAIYIWLGSKLIEGFASGYGR